MTVHPALKTKTWKLIRSLISQRKSFIIRNQYDETKWVSPNSAIYNIDEMRGWFKFCWDMGDIMKVGEVDTTNSN